MSAESMAAADEKVSRGRQAEELLNHPLWVEAWSGEMRRITDLWVNSPPNQTDDDRRELHRELQALKNVRSALTRWVRQGESAAKMLATETAKLNGAGERSGG